MLLFILSVVQWQSFPVLSLWHDVFCLPNLKFGATVSRSIPPLSYLSKHQLERFLAMIAFPFRYRSLFPRTRAKICVAATWISRLLETSIFLGVNFVFIMSILCLFLAFFTLSLLTFTSYRSPWNTRGKLFRCKCCTQTSSVETTFSSHWICRLLPQRRQWAV